MIVRNGTGLKILLRELVLRHWHAFLFIIAVELAIGELYEHLPGFHTTIFSANAVAMLATVVGIFLVFRFNNAYQRWWEARILWGGMVNTCRNFGRQVTTLLTPERVGSRYSEEELATLRRRLVYRQIAYVNALRLRLRNQPATGELDAWLEPGDIERLEVEDNKPGALVQWQLRELSELLGRDTGDQVLLAHIDSSLNVVMDVQGGCERIKNTAFPDLVRVVSKIFVWGIATLIPVVFLEPGEAIYPIEFVAVLFIAMAFIVVEKMAINLMDPFENNISDTPMSTLCRNIERDLRAQLGETDLPPALQPDNGVLM